MNYIKDNSFILPIVLFAVLSSVFITADPPLTLTTHHTPWVDPPVYLETVKSKILAGEWNSSGFQIHYPVYIYPVYWMFMLFGQSYLVLRIFSVLSVSAGLFFILASLRKYVDSRILFWGSFFIINYILLMYSRLGLHHCFMFIWTGLSVYFVSRERNRAVCIFLSGVCAALAFMTVFYVFIFIVPLFIFILCEAVFVNKQWKGVFLAAGGFLLVLLIYLITFRLSIGDLFNYLISVFIEKKTQFHGQPTAHLNVMWQIKTFFGRMPFLTSLSFLFLLFILFNIKKFYSWFLWFERLGFMWLGFGIIMLAVFQYRPIRYHLIILPPMVLLVIGFIRNFNDNESPLYNSIKKVPLIVAYVFLSIIILILFYKSEIIMFPENDKYYFAILICFFLLLPLLFIINKKRLVPERIKYLSLISIILFSFGINLFQYYYYFIMSHDNLITKANKDLSIILNDKAVVTGVYDFIFLFGNKLLNEKMITNNQNKSAIPSHYIIIPKWTGEKEAIAGYKDIGKSAIVKYYTLRGFEVLLLRNMSNPSYTPTEFEKGVELYLMQKYKQAYTHFYTFYQKHPSQLDNLSYLAKINWIMGNRQEALHFFKEILYYHKKSLAGRINLAIAYAQLENYNSARELLLDARKDEYVDSDIDELLGYIDSNKKPPFKGFLSFDYFISNLIDVFYRTKVK